MGRRAEDLVERLRTFNEEVIAFVESCSEEDWRKVCAWEQWTVGVTARHIGAGHYSAMGLAKMIVNGQKLPELTTDRVVRMANQHASDHADCSRDEVLDILRKQGDAMLQLVAGLDDAGLDRTAHLAMMGRDVTAQQLIETVVLKSGSEHLANMKAAVAL